MQKHLGLYDKTPILNHGFIQLVDVMGDDEAICIAARQSTTGDSKGAEQDRQLIRYMLKNHHTSPFEQVEFKFLCKMPIFVARQWVRHRMASLNEFSGRYSKMPKEFYVPSDERLVFQDKKNKQGSAELQVCGEDRAEIHTMMRRQHDEAYGNYEHYLRMGLVREVARVNLPLSTYTQWMWKSDLHNLFHFLKLRLHPHAQWELRQYANRIWEIVQEVVPMAAEAFNDYVLEAETFSRMEMAVLRRMLDIVDLGDTSLTPTELADFSKKLRFNS